MLIEEKFNKRSAELVPVMPPTVRIGRKFNLGIKVEFYAPHPDQRTISMHLTPDEAMAFASKLMDAAWKAKDMK
jgi:hypothetical protein